MNLKTIGILLLCLLSVQSIKAQQTDTLTIQQAIKIGLENNFAIRIANNELEIARNNNTLGNAGFLPSVTADASLNKRVQDNKTIFAAGTIPDRNDIGAETTVANYGIDATWTIFDGLSMFATADRLEIENQMSDLEARLMLESVLTDIITTYYQIVGQQQVFEVFENTLGVSNERIRIAETKLDLGSGSKYDLLQAQADYNADKAALIRSGTGLKQAKVLINQILATSAQINFNVQSSIDLGETINAEEVQALAASQNLELMVSRLSEEVVSKEIKEITGEWFPEIAVGAGYRFNRVEASQGFSVLNETTGFNYGITARINLFDGFNKQRRRQNAGIELKNEQLRIQEQELIVRSEIGQIYEEYLDALELISLENDNLIINRQSLDIALERYQLGTINAVELREAQLSLLNAENRLISAKIEAKLSETRLLRLSGQLVQQVAD